MAYSYSSTSNYPPTPNPRKSKSPTSSYSSSSSSSFSSLPRYKGFQLYADTYLANYFLQKVANDPGIASYNNIITGANNTATGNKNLIFGTGNNVSGSNNYVFSQDYDSSQTVNGNQLASHHLVLDDWLIELLKMYMIPFTPKNAIQQWK